MQHTLGSEGRLSFQNQPFNGRMNFWHVQKILSGSGAGTVETQPPADSPTLSIFSFFFEQPIPGDKYRFWCCYSNMMPTADTAIWLIVSAQLTSITLMLALKGNTINIASELASYFLNKMGKKIYCRHHPSHLQIYMPWCHLFISKATWDSAHFCFVGNVASLNLRWIFIWFILLYLMFSLICERQTRAERPWQV